MPFLRCLAGRTALAAASVLPASEPAKERHFSVPEQTGVHLRHPSVENERRCSAGTPTNSYCRDERWVASIGVAGPFDAGFRPIFGREYDQRG